MSEKRERPARAVKLNVINEPKESYTGGKSSLCPVVDTTKFQMLSLVLLGKVELNLTELQRCLELDVLRKPPLII